MKPSKRDALLERARSLLYADDDTSTTAKAGEAQRTDRMRELSEAEETAQLVLSDDPENAEATLLLAELSSLKRDWDQAILRWNAVIQRSSDREGLAYFRLAEAYRNTGSFHRARSAIQKVNPGDVDSDELQLAKRKIGARENEVAARVVGNRYVRVLLKDRKDETARSLLEAALVLRNDVSHVAQAITDVADVVEGRVSPSQQLTAAEGRSAQAGNMSRCAFVCGFGWSGSGAVYD
jgi:tetratricopeptide (TPR) repeat protein